MDLKRLQQILDRAPTKRILVIGDLMLDEFVWGKVGRISPEAPVPVVEVTGESFYPGGAANVAQSPRVRRSRRGHWNDRRRPQRSAGSSTSGRTKDRHVEFDRGRDVSHHRQN